MGESAQLFVRSSLTLPWVDADMDDQKNNMSIIRKQPNRRGQKRRNHLKRETWAASVQSKMCKSASSKKRQNAHKSAMISSHKIAQVDEDEAVGKAQSAHARIFITVSRILDGRKNRQLSRHNGFQARPTAAIISLLLRIPGGRGRGSSRK